MKTGLQIVLLGMVILAASVKSYSLYATTVDGGGSSPAEIISGRALGPTQYRLLVPLLWRAATWFRADSGAADRAVVVSSIVFCYAALAASIYRSSRSIPVTSLCLVAFYGAAASGFWFRHRDTFFEVAFTCIGMSLVAEKRPRWLLYALLSAVASLNRETWLFSLTAAFVSRWAEWGAAGVFRPRRPDVIGLVASTVLAAGILAAVHVYYGPRPYINGLWPSANNLKLLLVAGSWQASLGQAVWFAGSGMFAVWILFAINGVARQVPFVLGFIGPLLVVSFLISNWAETRIFISAYAVMIISISGGRAAVAGMSRPPAGPEARSALPRR